MKESRNFNTGQYFFLKDCSVCHHTQCGGLEIFIQASLCGKCHIISRHLTIFHVLPSHVGLYVQVHLLTCYCTLILPRGALPTPCRHYPSMHTQASPRDTQLGVASRRKTSHLHRFKGSIKLKVMEEELLVRARVTVQLRQNYFIERLSGTHFPVSLLL